MRKRRGLFAEGPDGTLYVELRVVMSPLVALVDGLPMTFFGKSKKSPAYMKIDDAIAWCGKEKENYPSETNPHRATYEQIIAVLEKVKRQVADEKAAETPSEPK